MTDGLAGTCGFLFVLNDDHASVLRGYRDMQLQRYWGHKFDLLVS